MSAPKRIPRRRTKGWRMPKGAVYVGRPTKWGNPFTEADFPSEAITDGVPWEFQWRDHAVAMFRAELSKALQSPYSQPLDIRFRTIAESIHELAGRDLVCWCPLDLPCHADILLFYANAEGTP